MSAGGPSLRVAYLFTRFPIRSETFLQREVRAVRELGVEVELHSLWGGTSPSFEGRPVHRHSLAGLPRILLGDLPRVALARPAVLREFLTAAARPAVPSVLNLAENLWGVGLALRLAPRFARRPPDLFHAPWASLPAACAWILGDLLHRPWTMGAHAYDLFEHGGDWLLDDKAARAALIHTSTAAGQRALLARGVPPGSIALIRRGLLPFPPRHPPRPDRRPLRLLAIGRLVEKKGFRHLLEILAHAARTGLEFEARVIGGGPLAPALRARTRQLGLEDRVSFPGPCEPPAALAAQAWADVFLFTGRVAPSGDRDGLPNVIPEALASGRPVLASPVGGVAEAIEDGRNGIFAPLDDPGRWLAALRALQTDDDLYLRLADAGHAWARRHFDALANSAQLVGRWREIRDRFGPGLAGSSRGPRGSG